VTVADVEQAYKVGLLEGERRVGRPFKGIPRVSPWNIGVEFRFDTSWFESYAAYERDAREELRQVQRWRWLEAKQGGQAEDRLREAREAERAQLESLRDSRRRWRALRRAAQAWRAEIFSLEAGAATQEAREARLRQLEQTIEDEIHAAVRAVDAELEEGRGRRCVIDAMRAQPQRPPGVRELRDLGAFIDGDRRRGVIDWPERHDAGGADFGFYWRLEDPLRRWETTEWRVSWLCIGEDPTHELYALEFLPEAGRRDQRTGRVWLLGKLSDWNAVEAAIGDLERYAQRERNSLIAVATAVRNASRDQAQSTQSR